MNVTSTTVGNNLEVQGSINLGGTAPNGGLQVTLTSSNPTVLLLSSSATGMGQSPLTINIPAGGTSATYYMQAFGSSGTVTYSVAATGYKTSTGTVTLTTSGFAIPNPSDQWDVQGYEFGIPDIIAHGQTPTTLTVYPVYVDASGDVQEEQLAPGPLGTNSATVNVNVNTGVGTVTPTSVTFGPGASTATTSYSSTTAGTATVSLTQPSGFTAPSFFTMLKLSVSNP